MRLGKRAAWNATGSEPVSVGSEAEKKRVRDLEGEGENGMLFMVWNSM